MTIPSVTTSTPAPVAAPKNGASATQLAAAATPDVSATLPPSPAPAPPSLDALLALVKQSAAARQDGLAVLMANALQAAATTTLPDPVQTAVDQLLALHLPTNQAPDATAVKTALQTSGLFTEAALASATTQMPVDVKTALLQLNQAAEAWLARAVIAADPKLEKTSQAAPAVSPASPQQPAGRTTTPVKDNTPVRSAPTGTSGTPSAPPAVRPGIQMPLPEIPAPVASPTPSTATAKIAATASAQTSAPAAAAVTPEPVPAGPASAPVPDSFKPVLRLLTRAVGMLESQQPTETPNVGAPALGTAPAKQAPANSTNAPLRVPISQPIKAAMTLLNQALDNWPEPQPAPASPSALPETVALAVTSKIAAQTFATAPQPSSPEEPPPVPPEIKAVLALLGKAVAPLIEGAPTNAPSDANAQASTPASPTAGNAASNSAKQNSAPATRAVTPPAATPVKTPAPAVSTDIASPKTAASNPALATPATATPSPVPLPPSSAQPPAPATPNDVRALLSLLSKFVEAEPIPDVSSAASNTAGRPAQPSVPPPTPGAPGKAQGPATPTLPDKADIALIAKTLATGSDAALARQTLLQIASLPDGSAQSRSNQARWIFDLPVMTAQGPAVAQIAIERDGRNATPDQPKPVWRVQFAIDIAPLGPVRASMALSGGQTWITIQAEKDDAIEKLRGQVSWLAGALQETDLEANIAVEPGRTARPARRSTPLVDRAS